MKRSLFRCGVFAVLLSHCYAAEKRIPVDTWFKGSPLLHPEKLSGVWQAEADHRIFGLQIVLTAKARRAAKNSTALIRLCDQADVEVFEQMGPTRMPADGNWFQMNSPGVVWNGNHLQIDSPPGTGPGATPEIHLDLHFDLETETWAGRFHRAGLERVIVLRRPRPSSPLAKSPFAGIWMHTGAPTTCLHILEEQGGDLAAWSDTMAPPGAVTDTRGISSPREFVERYGIAARVQLHSAHNIFVRLNALSPICCALDMGGALTPDGARIRSDLQPENKRNPADDWLRINGNSSIPQ